MESLTQTVSRRYCDGIETVAEVDQDRAVAFFPDLGKESFGIAAASERVFEFLDEEEMKDEKDIKKVLNKEDVKGKIEFDNIVFKYDDNDKPTINNFTATALPRTKSCNSWPNRSWKNDYGKSFNEIL